MSAWRPKRTNVRVLLRQLCSHCPCCQVSTDREFGINSISEVSQRCVCQPSLSSLSLKSNAKFLLSDRTLSCTGWCSIDSWNAAYLVLKRCMLDLTCEVWHGATAASIYCQRVCCCWRAPALHLRLSLRLSASVKSQSMKDQPTSTWNKQRTTYQPECLTQGCAYACFTLSWVSDSRFVIACIVNWCYLKVAWCHTQWLWGTGTKPACLCKE